VILLIFSSVPAGAGITIRCNVSSWYVEPAFSKPGGAARLAGIKHQERQHM